MHNPLPLKLQLEHAASDSEIVFIILPSYLIFNKVHQLFVFVLCTSDCITLDIVNNEHIALIFPSLFCLLIFDIFLSA